MDLLDALAHVLSVPREDEEERAEMELNTARTAHTYEDGKARRDCRPLC